MNRLTCVGTSVALFLIACVSFPPTTLFGADDALQQQQAAAASKAPSGVQFTLTLPSHAFHMGELIPLEYTFSSSISDHYILNAATYDRSGRLDYESFHLDPADGAADPLKNNFGFPGAVYAGGLRSTPTLSATPQALRFNLNEWVRFDRPGKYRMYLSTRRVAEKDHNDKPAAEVVSNIVEFEILPFDAQWSEHQLALIVGLLDANPKDEQLSLAEQRLRFLNTPDSWRELSRRLDGAIPGWQLEAGLYGASDRKAAIAAMEARMIAPDQPVTLEYLQTLGQLRWMSQTAPRPSGGAGPIITRVSGQPFSNIDVRDGQHLRDSLPQKNDRAAAVSLITLFRLPDDVVARLGTLSSPANILDSLPADDQIAALNVRWKWMRSPRLLESLLRHYQATPAENLTGNEKSQQTQLHDLYLLRAYDLDPQGVTPLLLSAIKNPANFSSYYVRSLLSLPAQSSADIDAALLDQLFSRPSTADRQYIAVKLINRYGSADILPRVKALFELHAGHWACEIQSPLLAYFLRVDEKYGTKMIAQCLAARGGKYTGCWQILLREVSGMIWTPALEKIAIAAVDDPEPQVVTSAADALRRKGSADCRADLIGALDHPWVASTTTDPRMVHGDPKTTRQVAIVTALLEGHNWILTVDEIKSIQAKCTVPEAATKCGEALNAPAVKLTVQSLESGDPLFYVANDSYESLTLLERKVSLYPPGTHFALFQFSNPSPVNDPLRNEFLDWAKSKNISVESKPL